LRKGESEIVDFTLTPRDLAFYRTDLTYAAEAGDFDVFIGSSSADLNAASFRLTEDVVLER
jgi:beta-glucosidase